MISASARAPFWNCSRQSRCATLKDDGDVVSTEKYLCRDCETENVECLLDADQFYWYKAKPHKPAEGATGHAYRYKNDMRRSQYCRRHTNARNAASVREKVNPKSPHYSKKLHDQQKKARRDYYNRKMNPKSPLFDAALHARHLASSKALRDRKKGG